MEFEPAIGFEVHAQLSTRTKIFCGCLNEPGGGPNTRVCPVCLGLPGALPVLNREALEHGLAIAVALRAGVQEQCGFSRKNYFYPDLPKGYQITQHSHALAVDGHIDVDVDGVAKRVGIREIHIEEDAGKTIHREGTSGSVSLIDMNRCGVPLVEIVTRPDIESPEEADAFLTALHKILVFLGVTSGSMHEGAMRFDTNVSVRRRGETSLGTQTEIKNLNSFKAVQNVLRYEIDRQSALLEGGGAVRHETLLWDAAAQRALPMRSKETASDYRYFPEPDLPDVVIDAAWAERIRNALPELPDDMRARFARWYGIPDYDARVLTARPDTALLYEVTVREVLRDLRPDLDIAFVQAGRPTRPAGGPGDPRSREPTQCGDVAELPSVAKTVSNWIMVIVGGLLNARAISLAELAASRQAETEKGRLTQLASRLAEIILPRLRGEINEPSARTLFEAAVESDEPIGAIIERLGLGQVSVEDTLRSVVSDVVASHRREAERCRAGETRLFGYLMGEVMGRTDGRANPELASRLLRVALKVLGEDRG